MRAFKVLSILFVALALCAPVAAKPRPVPVNALPVLPEVPVLGEMIFVDEQCRAYYSSQEIGTQVRDYKLDLNGMWLVNGVHGYVELTGTLQTDITGGDGVDYLNAADGDSGMWAKMKNAGSDWGHLLGWELGTYAYAPTRRSKFVWSSGLAYTTCGGPLHIMRHESAHRLGLQHDKGAPPDQKPPVTEWGNVCGEVRPDGTGDPVSYAKDPGPIMSHSKECDNRAQAIRAFPWAVSYNSNPVVSSQKGAECKDGQGTACLAKRLLVQVQPADVGRKPWTWLASFRPVRSTGNTSTVSFMVGDKTVRVTATSRKVRRAGQDFEVLDLGIVAPASSTPYFVVVVDTATGRIRVWMQDGSGFTRTVPEAFSKAL